MNKQKGPNRIEWADYTVNPIGGCKHRCRWLMPDNTTVVCYAETTANRVAQAAYPEGFEHHYWRPHLLKEPLKVKEPAKIFVGSMADVFGHWVPAQQIQDVLDMCRKADWHTFQFLTKNPVRLRHFDFPPNCWVGISSPPSFMGQNNQALNDHQQDQWFDTAIGGLRACNAQTKWISFEPLAYDIADRSWSELDDLFQHRDFKWAVIGAASSGKTYYQPDPAHVQRLTGLLDAYGKSVFFKGNLKPSLGVAFPEWREEFPS